MQYGDGTTYVTSGMYNDTLPSAVGCDSIITLDLTINESYDILDTLYRCVGDSAFLAGSYQTISGLYVDTLQSINGCDSILRTELIFNNPIYSTIDVELCYGDSALFGGVYYGVSGVYRDTLQAQAGCDSVSKLVLTVKDLNVGDTLLLVACDSAEWRGTKYMTSGIYSDTLQSSAGCDSIMVLDLTINGSNAADTTVLTACDSTVWGGTTYTTSGIYSDTLQSSAGCDSIMVLDLTIVSPVTNNVDSTICYGDSALLAGSYQSASGSYRDTLVGGAVNTCDSIVVTLLTVLPENVGDTTVLTACDSTVWNGTTYVTSGMYNDTLPSIAGCDSIVTLDLTIVSPVTNNVDSTICYGDSALLGGSYQSVSGSYRDTLVGGAANTCDSIVVTLLTVLPENVGDTTVLTACDSTVWGGTTYTATGVYNDTLPSAVGCDSIVTLRFNDSKSSD